MVRIFSHTHTLDHEWDQVSMAIWRKYPNPFSAHVLAGDCLARWIDGQGRLHTQRIFLKTGHVPHWMRTILRTGEQYVLEESVVDVAMGVMTVKSKNLTNRKLMLVEESTEYQRVDHGMTRCNTVATFTCGLGGWVATRAESLGFNRFREHFAKSKRALLHVLNQRLI